MSQVIFLYTWVILVCNLSSLFFNFSDVMCMVSGKFFILCHSAFFVEKRWWCIKVMSDSLKKNCILSTRCWYWMPVHTTTKKKDSCPIFWQDIWKYLCIFPTCWSQWPRNTQWSVLSIISSLSVINLDT